MATQVEQLESWLENFTEFLKSGPGTELSWLRRLREDAFACFCRTGFPTTKDEDWRFTNVQAIARTSFRPASAAELKEADVAPFRVEGAAAQLVFVNGRFAPGLSRMTGLPKGVTVASLAASRSSSIPRRCRSTWGSMPTSRAMHLRAEHGVCRGWRLRPCGTRRCAGSADRAAVSVDEGRCAGYDASAEFDSRGGREPGCGDRGLCVGGRRVGCVVECGDGAGCRRERSGSALPDRAGASAGL